MRLPVCLRHLVEYRSASMARFCRVEGERESERERCAHLGHKTLAGTKTRMHSKTSATLLQCLALIGGSDALAAAAAAQLDEKHRQNDCTLSLRLIGHAVKSCIARAYCCSYARLWPLAEAAVAAMASLYSTISASRIHPDCALKFVKSSR